MENQKDSDGLVTEMQCSNGNALEVSVDPVNAEEVKDLTRIPHGGQKMSSALKERLKRLSRVQSSPLSSSTQSKDCCRFPTHCEVKSTVKKESENKCSFSIEAIEECDDKASLLEIYTNLQKEIAIKREELRKLKLVEKHHSKNAPNDLDALNQRWVTSAQIALQKLYKVASQPNPLSFKDFLLILQIDCNIIKYNVDEECFT